MFWFLQAGADSNCFNQEQLVNGSWPVVSGACKSQEADLQSTHGPVAGYWKNADSLTHVILKVSLSTFHTPQSTPDLHATLDLKIGI